MYWYGVRGREVWPSVMVLVCGLDSLGKYTLHGSRKPDLIGVAIITTPTHLFK